jgi:curved DNA-binding protein CbpA
VHPDKNQDDKDRAQTAFEIINKSWKVLENDITRKKCLDVYEEAKDRTDFMIAEKKKKLKKDGRTTEVIPEDDPQKYKHAVYVMVMKLFADMERRRQQLDTRDMEERKRKREHEIDEEEAHKMNKEWQKNFEVKNLLVITLKSSLYFFLSNFRNPVKIVSRRGTHFKVAHLHRKRRKNPKSHYLYSIHQK